MTGETLGDGIGPDTDHGVALCNLLGLDPAEVHRITVEIEPGAGAVIRWESHRKVPLSLIAEALATAINEQDARRKAARRPHATWPDPPPDPFAPMPDPVRPTNG